MFFYINICYRNKLFYYRNKKNEDMQKLVPAPYTSSWFYLKS